MRWRCLVSNADVFYGGSYKNPEAEMAQEGYVDMQVIYFAEEYWYHVSSIADGTYVSFASLCSSTSVSAGSFFPHPSACRKIRVLYLLQNINVFCFQTCV